MTIARCLTHRPSEIQTRHPPLSQTHTPPPPSPWHQVSARALLWNFTGALVLRLLAMVLIPAVVSVVAGAWTGVYGADGQFVQVSRQRDVERGDT